MVQALKNVHVISPDTGLPVVVKAGEEIPEELLPLVTNPKVIGTPEPEAPAEPIGGSEPGIDTGTGPLNKRKVDQLRNLAAKQDPPIDLEGCANKEEIIDRLEAADLDGDSV